MYLTLTFAHARRDGWCAGQTAACRWIYYMPGRPIQTLEQVVVVVVVVVVAEVVVVVVVVVVAVHSSLNRS